MASHSSVLAWRIPGMGSHRVGHDWSDLAVAYVNTYIYIYIHTHIYNIYTAYINIYIRIYIYTHTKSWSTVSKLQRSKRGHWICYR